MERLSRDAPIEWDRGGSIAGFASVRKYIYTDRP